MDIYTTYPVRISRYHKIFQDTVSWYRNAVDFFIRVILSEEDLFILKNQTERVNAVERLTVTSAKRPEVKYDFGKDFYKFPAYYRRAAIAEALGCVSSYRSRVKNWEAEDVRTRGKEPSLPKAGFTSPALYRKNCYIRESDYAASIKVWVNNTWDWVTVSLRKSDADYILKHCRGRKECVPVLRKRGRKWYLDFSFEEKTKLHDTPARTSWSLPWTLASTTHVPAVCLQQTARSQEGASFPSLQKTTVSKKPPAGSTKHSAMVQKGYPACGHVQKASVMPSR